MDWLLTVRFVFDTETFMAHPWRIQYEGALYHVFSRGNHQQDIFVTDDDRYLFLDTLGQMCKYHNTITKAPCINML